MDGATLAIIVLCVFLAVVLLKDITGLTDWLRGGFSQVQNDRTYAFDSSSGLWCRARPGATAKNNRQSQSFVIDIRGGIFHAGTACATNAELSVIDVTDANNPLDVKSASDYSAGKAKSFVHKVTLGSMSTAGITLSSWSQIASLHSKDMVFPRRGLCKLKFIMTVFNQSDQILAEPCCYLDFDNPEQGYQEELDQLEKVKNLAIAIALTVASVEGKIAQSKFEVIHNWVEENLSGAGQGDSAKIEKALRKAVHFFETGKQLDIESLCGEIVQLASPGQRYDIMELCLQVAAADNRASREELEILKAFSHWLDLDIDRFRHMVETMLPLHMHEVQDAELILGICQGMTAEQSRHRLNLEYRKWNARVTNPDPNVQSQADQMLSLIAEARNQFVS